MLLRNRVIVWVYKFVYKTKEGMRVSEEFTSSLQVAKASKHKGFNADYYSHSIVAGGLLEIS